MGRLKQESLLRYGRAGQDGTSYPIGQVLETVVYERPDATPDSGSRKWLSKVISFPLALTPEADADAFNAAEER